jgi:hypothetical protein
MIQLPPVQRSASGPSLEAVQTLAFGQDTPVN